MKIDWGKGIVIAIVLFMSFILYFVFKVQLNRDYDNELVVQDYYKEEKNIDASMAKETNAKQLSEKVVFTTDAQGVHVQFPESFDHTKISGTVSLYRPSNQKLDFEIPVSLSNSHLLIPRSSLVDGHWGITVDWQYEMIEYLNKHTTYIH
ncbi:MAG: FixH family protein [Flavobacterium sp.]